jgi:DNA (cytosine-5)-methyltransferase 1
MAMSVALPKIKTMSPKVIDLFAGCGGLSLGLEQAGFEPVFVNELNPDAMSTYLRNRNGLGLEASDGHAFDVKDITKTKDSADAFGKMIRTKHGEIDLVCGGPPCQGYSGIGHRRTFKLTKEEIPTNHLYEDMADVVRAVAPRAFLFENVRGLLNSKWGPDGENGEIWRDIRQTFSRIQVNVNGKKLGYEIGWKLVYAKDFGVPQNRPRVLMVGLREDIVFHPSDTQDKGLLPVGSATGPDLVDLLGDLVDPEWRDVGSTNRYLVAPQTEIQEGFRVPHLGRSYGKGDFLSEQEYSNHSDQVIEKFTYMLANGKDLPEHMRTKKFSQRPLPARWGENGPSITATSLPDDYVHFSQPRVLTVREWARLQYFPDWYEFSGKRTTGGRRRAGDPDAGDWSREVPKYTQIGNAVPVELARQVGLHLKGLL